ncbi:MAG: thiamine phosphate synthase [Bryobacterales bacterium]|nr:thiamine phosphate synthase [Bryobacterales bacterium]
MMLPRLYPIVDQGLFDRLGFPVLTAALAMLEAGVSILQWRAKGHITRQMFADAEKMAEECWRAGAHFVVNDRADIAHMLHAGVHVGQDDLPAAVAREIAGQPALIGLSTHNEAQLRAAASAPVDYVAVGPIFGTSSKANPDPTVGLAQLKQWRALTDRPVVAIGGIDRLHAHEVLDAGADSIALIRDLIPENPTRDEIRRRTAEWVELVKP